MHDEHTTNRGLMFLAILLIAISPFLLLHLVVTVLMFDSESSGPELDRC